MTPLTAAQRQTLAMAAPAVALGGWLLATAGLLWATLDGDERASLSTLLAPRGAIALVCWVAASAACAVLVRWLLERHAALLASAQDELAAQRDAARAEVQRQVAEGARSIEQERQRLAALMSELSQAVVVCNLDGIVLLYNEQARALFRGAAPVVGGAEVIGLARSIHTVLDQAQIEHAVQDVAGRLRAGEARPGTQFITATANGALWRVQLAAVREAAAHPEQTAELSAPKAGLRPACPPRGMSKVAEPHLLMSGYVLMLQDISAEFDQDTQRDQLLQELIEGSRAALGTVQAALEMLAYPDLGASQRERFQGVVREEVGRLGERVTQVAQRSGPALHPRWPLHDMPGTQLLAALSRRIQAQTGLLTETADVAADLWLKVDSFSLIHALSALAARLASESTVQAVALRLTTSGRHAQLELAWRGPAPSPATAAAWQNEPLHGSGAPLTLNEVALRHGGECWLAQGNGTLRLCLLLPLAAAPAQAALRAAESEATVAVYDFDLFARTAARSAWDDQALSSLSFTVFDTETTGLNPSQGDEIIQIGAVRIVNGRLLRNERFEQLVDPQRSLPGAGIAIHGITPLMLRGQPTLAQVLPAFHAFAQDTVLVAHNAAFDMRFLQLKEASTGCRFEQPVLDTLLLSAVAHRHHSAHSLEAIAQRVGVPLIGRHTALGDALLAAEVFLKLIELLHAQGIRTLGQARAAAQKTDYARLTY